MINDYLLYITLALTITTIPGPSVVLTIKNSIKYGFKTAVAGIFGNFIAMILLATVTALGLGAIILASSTLFTAVKVIGGFYLIYLGVKSWRMKPASSNESPNVSSTKKKEFRAVFNEGFVVGISNPKAIAFFTALFPHFIDPTRSFVPQFLTLILTIEAISCFVLMAYAMLSSKAAGYLCKEGSMYFFHKLTGGAFIGFGIGLLYEK